MCIIFKLIIHFLDIGVTKKTRIEEFQVQPYYFVLIADISKHNFKHSEKKRGFEQTQSMGSQWIYQLNTW